MTVQQLKTDVRLQFPAALLTLAGTLLLPLMVHASTGPSGGATWLPLFYAPLLAALLFHPAVGLLAALLAPLLNLWLLGAPPAPMAMVLTLELLIFTLTLQLIARRWSHFWGAAPLAFVAAKAGSVILLSLTALLPVPPLTYALGGIQSGWPGLIALLLLNWLMVRGVRRDR